MHCCTGKSSENAVASIMTFGGFVETKVPVVRVAEALMN